MTTTKMAAPATRTGDDGVLHARLRGDLQAGVAAMHTAGISFDHGGAQVVAAYLQACAIERHGMALEALLKLVAGEPRGGG